MKIPGWCHIRGSVYEHYLHGRLHLLGLLRRPNGEFIEAFRWPQTARADRAIQIAGGNRKRGLMLWAQETKGANQ